MKHRLGRAAIIAAIALVPATATAGELRLSIANGRVTLVAQDVTVKQILDEWGRVGQTTIIGAERLDERVDLARAERRRRRARPRVAPPHGQRLHRQAAYARRPAPRATTASSSCRRAARRRSRRRRNRSPIAPSRRSPYRRRSMTRWKRTRIRSCRQAPCRRAAAVPRPAADAARCAARHAAADDGAAPGPVADAEPRGPWIPRRYAAGPAGAPAGRPGVELQRVPPAAGAARRPRWSGRPGGPGGPGGGSQF